MASGCEKKWTPLFQTDYGAFKNRKTP